MFINNFHISDPKINKSLKIEEQEMCLVTMMCCLAHTGKKTLFLCSLKNEIFGTSK